MAFLILLILVGGVLLYALSGNAKVSEIGRLMFFAALVALCITVFAPLAAKLFH
jgi:hypothetical protein